MDISNDKITIKQRIVLKLIFFAITVLNPTKYTHQISKPLEEIEKLIKQAD